MPARVGGAVDRGPVESGERLRLVVGVKLAAPVQLAPAPLAPEDFGARWGASAADYQALVDELRAAGPDLIATTPARTTVTVEGPAAAVEAALGTTLHRFEDGRGNFRAPTREPQLTGPLTRVSAIVGLDDAVPWKRLPTLHHVPTPDAVCPSGLTPSSLQAMYGASSVTQQGTGQTVAILGAGGPPDPVKDVGAFVTRFGLPTNVSTQYTQNLLGGPTRDDPNLSQNEYQENVLDAEMVFTFAPKANVVHVVTATNSPGLFADGVNQIVNSMPSAHAVSVSYGLCERFSAPTIPVMETLLAQARAQGQQWFFASGDAGTDDCGDGAGNVVLSVNWPASSPNAIGVGGTQLNGSTEVVWGGGFGGGAGGGGRSEDFDKPAYQAGVGPTPSDGARDVPDVAAMSGSPGVLVVLGGQCTSFYGTSCATPMWAGMWAVLLQAKNATGGWPQSLETLYAVGKSGTGFHDITAGNNGVGTTPGFSALAGYDLATGWGSPDLPSLIAAWK